jgi:hypothetical protein
LGHLPYLSRADPCPRRQIQAQIFCFAASGAPGSTPACRLPTSKTGCAPSTKKKGARKKSVPVINVDSAAAEETLEPAAYVRQARGMPIEKGGRSRPLIEYLRPVFA